MTQLVEQSDREAAARHVENGIGLKHIATRIRQGDFDHHETVQAFARHRIESLRLAGQDRGELQALVALVEACEREFTSDLTETDGDPENGPWRDEDDEAVSHGLGEDGHTIVPGNITFGHIRRARAALNALSTQESERS